MKCLVCHQLIVINRFKEVLSIQSPLLCVSCQNQMIRKKGGLLFEENEWLKSVIERLNKGDIILTKCLINRELAYCLINNEPAEYFNNSENRFVIRG